MLATPLNIAIAHDEAFDCYFRDTLDVLESQGARLNVFSPLRSESLPVGTDVVYLGGGSLERHANDLASNVCLKESLWGHVIGGGRIYAECAGLAYLCREMILPGDHSLPMVGLLPAVARRHVCPEPERAVEIVTQRESWLFPSRQSVRGYLNSNWCIEPEGCFAPSPVDAKRNHDLIGDYQIVGSRLRLNFAARPDCLDRFFQPFDRAGLNTVS